MRPLNLTGDPGHNGITELFRAGESVRAWARYWNTVNAFMHDIAQRYPHNCRIFRHEDLCSRGYESLSEILEFTELECSEENHKAFAHRLRPPTYYKVPLTDEQLGVIREETADTAARYGYQAAG